MGYVAVGVIFESIGWAMHQRPWSLVAERFNVWVIDQRHRQGPAFYLASAEQAEPVKGSVAVGVN